MILQHKRDSEAWFREKTLESMKANAFLSENDIVEVINNSFYKIVSSATDIQLNNGLYAEVIPPIKASKDDYGYSKVGNGLNVLDGVISHPEKHSASEIETDINNRFVTDEQISSWNDKVNNQDFQNAINDIVDKAIKGATWKPPVNTFEDIATTYPEPKDTWTVTVMDTNKIYMYNAETKEWQDYGKMIEPNLNFNNQNPCINEVGGIDKGTSFNNVPILQIIHDMLYNTPKRDYVEELYYGIVENKTDYDLSKYTKKTVIKFPVEITTKEMNNNYFNILFKNKKANGEPINITDLTLFRISDEIKEKFGLNTNQIEMENAFEIKPLDIKGENYILITSLKILSGSYNFLLTMDNNKTIHLTNRLFRRINELESIVNQQGGAICL